MAHSSLTNINRNHGSLERFDNKFHFNRTIQTRTKYTILRNGVECNPVNSDDAYITKSMFFECYTEMPINMTSVIAGHDTTVISRLAILTYMSPGGRMCGKVLTEFIKKSDQNN